MNFEYDPDKSASNKVKHDIDFETAQKLWLDKNALQLKVPFDGENRHLVIAKISGKRWTALICYRGENVRIISVRRSRKQEVDCYEKQD